MSAEFWSGGNPVNTALLLGVIVFLWRLSRDMASLRERMAKLEGAMDGFTKGFSIEN